MPEVKLKRYRKKPVEVEALVERLRERIPPEEPQPSQNAAGRSRRQHRQDLIDAADLLLATYEPVEEGEETDEEVLRAERERADRLEVENAELEDANRSLAKMRDKALEDNLAVQSQPVEDGGGEERIYAISYCGGPLDGVAGFASDLRPLVLDAGSYRFDAFHPEGDAEFEWWPTDYPVTLESTSAHPQHSTEEGPWSVVAQTEVHAATPEIEATVDRLAREALESGANADEMAALVRRTCFELDAREAGES